MLLGCLVRRKRERTFVRGGDPGFARLDTAVEAALGPVRARSEPFGVLYSGGVDSSLLAWELRDRPGLALHTVGVRGSADLDAARSGAERIGLPWSGTVVEPAAVRSIVREAAPELSGLAGVARRVLASFAVAVQTAHVAHLLCGQGIDELFLGYAHFRELSEGAAAERAEADLRRLQNDEWPRSVRIAARFGSELLAPFLDLTFVEAARSIPLRERVPRGEAKAYFRAWARHRGLPDELAGRPKRALQYGSGLDRIVRRADDDPR